MRLLHPRDGGEHRSDALARDRRVAEHVELHHRRSFDRGNDIVSVRQRRAEVDDDDWKRASRASTSPSAARKRGSSNVIDPRLWTSTCSAAWLAKPAAMIWSARPLSPLPRSSSCWSVMPVALPSTTAAITKASQPRIAVLR